MQKKWISIITIFIFQLVMWNFISKSVRLLDLWFEYIYINYNQLISTFTSYITFPIGEIFYLSSVLLLVIFIVSSIRNFNLGKVVFNLFLYLNIFLFIYNLIWGMNYYQQKFDFNYIKLKIKDEELKELYCRYMYKTYLIRTTLSSHDKKPIDFIYNIKDYQKDFSNQQHQLQEQKWIKNYSLIEDPKVKFSKVSTLQNYIGILGYYNPFTVESNVNANNTPLKIPFTMAHELAHQMGFGSENEANFIAYYFGVNSKIKEVQYAAYYKTTFSLLFSLLNTDPLFVKIQLENLPEGIKTDRLYELAYYSRFEGKSNDVFSALNNQFLKANNQDGTISYSKYIELVYYYEIYIKKGLTL